MKKLIRQVVKVLLNCAMLMWFASAILLAEKFFPLLPTNGANVFYIGMSLVLISTTLLRAIGDDPYRPSQDAAKQ